MASVREFLQTSAGKGMAVAVIILGIAAAGWSIWSNVGQPTAVKAANTVVFLDIETGKTFDVELTPDMAYPAKSPYSGHMTGYMAEACGWTKDGHVRKEPFYVVLNSELGKPGPTFCPDCGRLVVAHNPPAVEGHRPPPTQTEYASLSHHYP